MKPYWIDKVLVLGLTIMLAISIGCSGMGAEPPDAQDRSGSLPFSSSEAFELSKGTPIYVHLQQPISSLTAETGQNFSAVLDEPIAVNGHLVASEGTPVSGLVLAARKPGRFHNAGYVRLALSSLTIDGKQVPIKTSSTFVEGGSLKNHNLAYIGGGSGSTLPGVGGSTLIGSLVGSGDTTAAYIMGATEVGFAADRPMCFRLTAPLNLP